jgi:protein arginine N-methyltransferase 1
MYDISAYGRMITDKGRMDAYSEALRCSVSPHSVVLDLGAGTGIFAILACQFGARKVFAIEPSDAITLAREAAVANGFQDRIQFIQKHSKRVELSEPATVLVSDLRGVLPFMEDHIPTLVDARRRLLVPGGTLIPRRDTLWAAIVESPDLYRPYIEPWDRNDFGLDLLAGQKLMLNTWRKVRVTPGQLLSEPQCWATLDYLSIDSPDIHGEIYSGVKRSGTGHGLIVWFDAVLSEAVRFSNRPAAPELIYGSAFFPWLAPVDLEAGDNVIVQMDADLVDDDYIWRWNTRIKSGPGSPQLKADFKQSTFFGAPLTSQRLRKSSAAHVPVLNDEGKVENLILSRMDGEASLERIAQELKLRFPHRFSQWEDALKVVGQTSQKYSQ